MKHNFNDHSPECCGPKFPPFCPEDKPPMGRPPMPPCGPMPPCPSVVSGMDLYEAVNNLTDRVNVCIHNYNAVMAESYKTLHNLQQAAQENGAYYGPDEVWVEEGYYADESSTYHLVHKACVDRRGEPIRMQLHLAYGNTTNSKIEQGIFNASKVEFADKMLVAIPKGEKGWYGKAIWHGAPIQSADEPTLYTVGFTRAGVMRVYNNGVSVDQMLRDTIENAMGCSGVLIQNGQLTDDSYRDNIPNAGQQTSRVCIGQNLDTREVIILTVGNENDVNRKGLTSKACAAILLGQGCDIAVELCEGVGSAAMDQGSLMYVPDDEQQPNAYAFWFISRKCFYKTDYERELAELIQNYGACIWGGFLNKKNIESVKNDLDAEIARAVAAENALGERVTEEVTRAKGEEQRIEGKLDTEIQRAKDAEAELQESINDETLRAKAEEQRIDAKVDAEVKRATDAEDELGVRIDAEVNRAKAEEQRIDGKVDAESARAKAAEAGLQSALDKEVHDRTNADSTLHQEILTEQGERTSADKVLQNNINTEASKRAEEDGKLQTAVNTEASTRAEEDGKLQSALNTEATTRANEDAKLKANLEAADTALGGRIDALVTRVAQCETDIDQLESLTAQMQQQMAGLDKSVSDMLVTVSSLETAMENVKQTVLSMNTIVQECNAKVEELNTKVDGMTSGQTVLPYVKKAGDTMTGPLVMGDAAGAAKGSVAVADSGVSLKAANGAFVKVDGTHVTIGDNAGGSVKMSGVANGTANTDAVNKGQLDAVKATADGANTAASAADTKATQASAAASAADTKATQASAAAAAADTKATQANTNASAAKIAADNAKVAADEAATEAAQASADVAEIVAGTKDLPYVKKSGDTMTGDLSFNTGLRIGEDSDTRGPLIDSSQAELKIAASGLTIDAGGSRNINVMGGAPNGTAIISGVGAGELADDAVNKGQLDAVSSTANAAKTAADEAAAEAAQASADVSEMLAGTKDLPYVKKAGDIMTGGLTFNRSPYSTSLSLLSNGKFNISNRDGARLSVDSDGVTFSDSLNDPVQVHGVKDGTATNDAVNYGQLDTVAGQLGVVGTEVVGIKDGSTVLPYVKDKSAATFTIPTNQTVLKCTDSANQVLAGAQARMGTGFAAKSIGGIATMLDFETAVVVTTIPDDGIVRWTVPVTKPTVGYRIMVCNPVFYVISGDTHTVIGVVKIDIDYNNNILCEFTRSDSTKTSVSIVMNVSALALVTE